MEFLRFVNFSDGTEINGNEDKISVLGPIPRKGDEIILETEPTKTYCVSKVEFNYIHNAVLVYLTEI